MIRSEIGCVESLLWIEPYCSIVYPSLDVTLSCPIRRIDLLGLRLGNLEVLKRLNLFVGI